VSHFEVELLREKGKVCYFISVEARRRHLKKGDRFGHTCNEEAGTEPERDSPEAGNQSEYSEKVYRE
jgi:hypothetical protein